MTVGENLKKLRKAAGFSSGAQVAEYLGLTPQAYRHYESDGANIPLKNLIKLAELFGCTSDEILGIVEPGSYLKDCVIQRRYNELSLESKQDLEEYLAYLEFREEDRARTQTFRFNSRSVSGVLEFLGSFDDSLTMTTGEVRDLYEKALREEVIANIEERRAEKSREYEDHPVDGMTEEEFLKGFEDAVWKRKEPQIKRQLKTFDELVGCDHESLAEALRMAPAPTERKSFRTIRY